MCTRAPAHLVIASPAHHTRRHTNCVHMLRDMTTMNHFTKTFRIDSYLQNKKYITLPAWIYYHHSYFWGSHLWTPTHTHKHVLKITRRGLTAEQGTKKSGCTPIGKCATLQPVYVHVTKPEVQSGCVDISMAAAHTPSQEKTSIKNQWCVLKAALTGRTPFQWLLTDNYSMYRYHSCGDIAA